MKFLSTNEKTVSELPNLASDAEWSISHFFFDFRATKDMPNTEQGLLRSLLYQITGQLPLEREVLSKYELTLEHILSAQESDKLIDILAELVKSEKLNILLFVDGLDEYEHDIAQLIDLLERIRSRARLRLCLASRPEPIIQAKLEKYPYARVQEYNASGIESYVRTTIRDVCSNVGSKDASFSVEPLIVYILGKAEGVFLWVHFAVSTLIEHLVIGCVEDEIQEALSSLPTQLDEMYDRIFEQIPAVCKPEAAMILMLIQNASHVIDLALLQSVWLYLQHVIGSKITPLMQLTQRQFLLRLRGFLGGLLDFEHTSDNIDHGFDNDRSISKDFVFRVRLVHETLRAYMRKRLLLERWAHEQIILTYSDNTWLRVYTEVLVNAKTALAAVKWELVLEVEATYKLARAKDPWPWKAARKSFIEQINKHTTAHSRSDETKAVIALHLLPYSILNLETVSSGAVSGTVLENALEIALQTPLLLLSLQARERQVGRPMKYRDHDSTYDLYFAAAKSWTAYFERNHSRLNLLNAHQRRYLFVCACGGSMTFDVSDAPRHTFRPLRDPAIPIVQMLLSSEPKIDNVYIAFMIQSNFARKTTQLFATLHSVAEKVDLLDHNTQISVNRSAWSTFVHSLWHINGVEIIEFMASSNLPHEVTKCWMTLVRDSGLNLRDWRDQSGNGAIRLVLKGSITYAKKILNFPNTDTISNTVKLIMYCQEAGATMPMMSGPDDPGMGELRRLKQGIDCRLVQDNLTGRDLKEAQEAQACLAQWLKTYERASLPITSNVQLGVGDDLITSEQAPAVFEDTTDVSKTSASVTPASPTIIEPSLCPENRSSTTKPTQRRRSRLFTALSHLRAKSLG